MSAEPLVAPKAEAADDVVAPPAAEDKPPLINPLQTPADDSRISSTIVEPPRSPTTGILDPVLAQEITGAGAGAGAQEQQQEVQPEQAEVNGVQQQPAIPTSPSPVPPPAAPAAAAAVVVEQAPEPVQVPSTASEPPAPEPAPVSASAEPAPPPPPPVAAESIQEQQSEPASAPVKEEVKEEAADPAPVAPEPALAAGPAAAVVSPAAPAATASSPPPVVAPATTASSQEEPQQSAPAPAASALATPATPDTPATPPVPAPAPISTAAAPIVAPGPSSLSEPPASTTTPLPSSTPSSLPFTPPVAAVAADAAPTTTTTTTTPLLPDAFPTPAGTTFDPVSASEPMQLDGPEPNVLKRPGEDLASADIKRVKEGGSGSASPSSFAAPYPPVSAPTATAVDPVTGLPIVYPWTNYQEPAPRNPGPSTPLTLQHHKYLTKVVGSLLKSHNSFNFREPVDVVRFNIPHYHDVIPSPMDLGTVSIKLHASDPRGPPKDKSKLANWDTSKGVYRSVAEVTKDVRQIWENTRKFNGRDHVVSQAADKLQEQYERQLKSLPQEYVPPVAASASPAGPSAPSSSSAIPRRQSISQAPVIRRADDSNRPKRDIHPPPSKDLNYEGPGSQRKPKRRNDPQLQWAARTLHNLEKTQKYYEIVSPFLFPVSEIIAAIPTYTSVVKKPIDLLMIKQRLEDNVYEDVSQIDADMRLLVSNARTFNPPGDAVHNAAIALLQLWTEKWRSLPPKQEPRAPSEDVAPEELDESDDEDKDAVRLREAKAERATLDREIADLEAKIARKPQKRKQKAPKAHQPKSSSGGAAAARKQHSAAVKGSPNANGNGVAKKPRKQKEQPAYREDDDSEEEMQSITTAQKQELAEKIQATDADTLNQAVAIIQAATNIASDEEIELDIDSLPAATQIKLYNLVCGGRKRGKNKKPAVPRKSGFGGAPGRKHLNEQEEADRIRKMEAQLQSFEGGRGGGGGGMGGGAFEDESSSEEESSDEE